MRFIDAREKLNKIQQDHLLNFWSILTPGQRHQLLDEIEALDEKTLEHQRQLLLHQEKLKRTFEPLTDYSHAGSAEDAVSGKKLLGDGFMGCILLAGGQGTRLNFEGPKGLFPISIIKHKTLFQLFAEKVAAASKWINKALPIAIMTSKRNDADTKQYFKEHQFFGLTPEQVHFFTQPDLPLLDQSGNLFLETVSHINKGPDGNGSLFKSFVDAGLWEKWYQQGVRFANIVMIDNPMADPFDAELLGFHYRKGADVTIKATARKDVHENVGLIVKEDQQVRVVEYTEIPPEEQTAINPDGMPKHLCANLGLYCLTMEFLFEVGRNIDLPLHLASKMAAHVQPNGTSIKSEGFKAWKFERFNFDVLPFAKKVATLLVPREKCFAPLKNYQGSDSVHTVQQALKERDRATFIKITNKPAPHTPFELAQDFYYPTNELLKKWHESSAPADLYIEP